MTKFCVTTLCVCGKEVCKREITCEKDVCERLCLRKWWDAVGDLVVCEQVARQIDM